MPARPIVAVVVAVVIGWLGAPSAWAHPTAQYEKQPVAVGYGGAVSSVDLNASRSGIDVAQARRQRGRRGGGRRGHARRDRAVRRRPSAAAASSSSTTRVPGKVVHPSTAGRPARRRCARTSSSTRRPASRCAFDEARAQRPVGRRAGHAGHLGQALAPLRHPHLAGRRCARAREVAQQGFPVDATFSSRTSVADRLQAFARQPRAVPARRQRRRAVGSTFRNPDLAQHLPADRPPRHGRLYRGPIGDEIARHRAAPAGRAAARTLPSGPA